LNKREIDIAIVSDVHLGTYGSHAKELLNYLRSIDPKTLVLNGDIIDIWQFSKNYWPESHMKVVREIFSMMSKGINVYYLTGNHDDMLRKFSDFHLQNFHLVDKLILNIDGKKAWIFHGDVFDISMKHSKWIAKLGATGYDLLILLNRMVNFLLKKAGKGKISFSKKIKNSVKTAVKFIGNFEETVTDIAIENNYSYVACGHIHQPEIRNFSKNGKSVLYLNSGDWVENLTALEYNDGEWKLYQYNASEFEEEKADDKVADEKEAEEKLRELLSETLNEKTRFSRKNKPEKIYPFYSGFMKLFL
jgi:UDP-2,3-diacylglucosamine pyrophosphatase LpxH